MFSRVLLAKTSWAVLPVIALSCQGRLPALFFCYRVLTSSLLPSTFDEKFALCKSGIVFNQLFLRGVRMAAGSAWYGLSICSAWAGLYLGWSLRTSVVVSNETSRDRGPVIFTKNNCFFRHRVLTSSLLLGIFWKEDFLGSVASHLASIGSICSRGRWYS